MNAESKFSRDRKRIETKLQEVLQPIKPPAAFVADLRERLDQEMIKKAKNRKVRKLREKYPEVRIKLLYRKDFVRMAQKYGL